MLQRTLIVLDLRSTGDLDFDATCRQVTISGVIQFLATVRDLDVAGLIRKGAGLETVALSAVTGGAFGSPAVVHNLLRTSRPRNISLKSIMAKVKTLCSQMFSNNALPSTDGGEDKRVGVSAILPAATADDFAWIETALNLGKAPSSATQVLDVLIFSHSRFFCDRVFSKPENEARLNLLDHDAVRSAEVVFLRPTELGPNSGTDGDAVIPVGVNVLFLSFSQVQANIVSFQCFLRRSLQQSMKAVTSELDVGGIKVPIRVLLTNFERSKPESTAALLHNGLQSLQLEHLTALDQLNSNVIAGPSFQLTNSNEEASQSEATALLTALAKELWVKDCAAVVKTTAHVGKIAEFYIVLPGEEGSESILSMHRVVDGDCFCFATAKGKTSPLLTSTAQDPIHTPDVVLDLRAKLQQTPVKPYFPLSGVLATNISDTVARLLLNGLPSLGRKEPQSHRHPHHQRGNQLSKKRIGIGNTKGRMQFRSTKASGP